MKMLKNISLIFRSTTSKFLRGRCISFQLCWLHFSLSQPRKHFRRPLLIHVIIQSDEFCPMWYHIRCCYLIRLYKHLHDKLIKPPAISCTGSFKGLQCRLSSCCCLDPALSLLSTASILSFAYVQHHCIWQKYGGEILFWFWNYFYYSLNLFK